MRRPAWGCPRLTEAARSTHWLERAALANAPRARQPDAEGWGAPVRGTWTRGRPSPPFPCRGLVRRMHGRLHGSCMEAAQNLRCMRLFILLKVPVPHPFHPRQQRYPDLTNRCPPPSTNTQRHRQASLSTPMGGISSPLPCSLGQLPTLAVLARGLSCARYISSDFSAHSMMEYTRRIAR